MVLKVLDIATIGSETDALSRPIRRLQITQPPCPKGPPVMARSPRSEYLHPSDSAVVFVICRSARTPLAPSPGDSTSPLDNHRVEFIESLIHQFARFFCISVHSHAVLPRELRLVLAAHPGLVQQLDDAEVAHRWLSLCPTLRHPELRSCEPTEEEILAFCSDPPRIAQTRSRLSDISWFLRLLQQRIALFCNREDKVKGRFWSDRYRSILILDQLFHALGMANVDLGALRIDSDKPLSASDLASALYRLYDCLEVQSESVPTVNQTGSPDAGSEAAIASAQWCSSEVPVLGQRPVDYPEFLEWIQLAFRGESPATVPAAASGVLQEVPLTAEVLREFLINFDLLFSHVAGSPSRMAAFVTKSGRRGAWVRPAARELFRRCSLRSPAVLHP